MKNKNAIAPSNRGKAGGLTSFVAAGAKYRFPRGVSGNPSGRSKDDAARIEARRLLESKIPNDPEGRIFAKGICHTLGWMALAGDKAAAEILFDRAFGRPPQSIAVDQGHDPLTALLKSMAEKAATLGPPPPPEYEEDEET